MNPDLSKEVENVGLPQGIHSDQVLLVLRSSSRFSNLRERYFFIHTLFLTLSAILENFLQL